MNKRRRVFRNSTQQQAVLHFLPIVKENDTVSQKSF